MFGENNGDINRNFKRKKGTDAEDSVKHAFVLSELKVRYLNGNK